MGLGKRVYGILALVAIVAVVGVAVALTSGTARSGVIPGQIDDGKELLGQATISLEAAIAQAEAAYSGALGEVDLEKYKGQLVFNIDIGEKDVKVSAADGTVLGYVEDDFGDNED